MYLDDLQVGQEFTTAPVTIKKEKMIAFAKEYDPFPLHYDEEYAAKTRFGKLVAPGVMSFMSVWAQVLHLNILGEEHIAGKSTRIEWFGPVHADDTLTGKVTITAVRPRNPYNGIAEVTTDIYNQHGVLVLRDVTESILMRRPEGD